MYSRSVVRFVNRCKVLGENSMKNRQSYWAKIKAFHYGEAFLWVLFLVAFLLAFENDNAGTLAGICALAAIGVRITRPSQTLQVRDDD
jgi:hypothetical protein